MDTLALEKSEEDSNFNYENSFSSEESKIPIQANSV